MYGFVVNFVYIIILSGSGCCKKIVKEISKIFGNLKNREVN